MFRRRRRASGSGGVPVSVGSLLLEHTAGTSLFLLEDGSTELELG